MFDFKRDKEEPVIMEITPDIARQLLNTSPGNRKIRGWHVYALADAMTRGEWRVTSQGIGIDTNGNLRDAHHRLMAVIKSNVTIRSLVVMGLPVNAYEVIDTGIKRNLSDLLQENKRVTDILNAAASIVYDNRRIVPVDQMRPIMDTGLYDTAKSLIKHCGATRSFYSSAPIKLAACITIMDGGDADYVMQQYKALCTLNFKLMSMSAMSLVKQVNDGKASVKNNTRKDIIARGLRVFDVKQIDSDESRIKPEDLEAAKNLVLNVLKIQTAEPATITAIDETEPQINETKVSGDHDKLTVDQEMKELLDDNRSTGKGYVHKSGDRNKYAY
jgi:hypothetical protein